VGVFVAQVGPLGYFPLGARLYLPAHWLRENGESAQKLIPEEDRSAATKAEIALRLLEEIRADSQAAPPIAVESGYLSSGDFVEELTKKGFRLEQSATESVEQAAQFFDWLRADFGLDHFEGRTWHGWHHHVGLVFAAYHFLMREPKRPVDPLDSSFL
jgi:SRSO17 transposase